MTDFRIYCLAHSMNDKPNGCELRNSCFRHLAVGNKKVDEFWNNREISTRVCGHEFNNYIKDETK